MYSSLFYSLQRRGSQRSAAAILPIVIAATGASSIVDVGCGAGTWLGVARQLGISTIVGIEGPWLSRDRLALQDIDLHHADLEKPLPALGRFDLAMCMEVAEHLSPGRAESLVDDLCALSDNILFSAAIAWQGGIRHVNERPQSYWGALFARRGFGSLDIVRPQVWKNGQVSYWYRQNAVLYSRGAPLLPAHLLDRRHPARFLNPWCVVEIAHRLRPRSTNAAAPAVEP